MPFKKGRSGNPKGRKAGVPNKVTTALKDAILRGGGLAGDATRDALEKTLGKATVKGLDGLTLYCVNLALTAPQVFGPLIGKVLPLKVTGDDGGPVLTRVIHEEADVERDH